MTKETTFTCSHCQRVLSPPANNIGTGYARDKQGNLVCYDCCAAEDHEHMRIDNRITLYLTGDTFSLTGKYLDGLLFVTNWPGTLKIRVRDAQLFRHPFSRCAILVHVVGPDGMLWSGRCIGQDSQLVHCRKTRERISLPRDCTYGIVPYPYEQIDASGVRDVTKTKENA